MSFDDCFRRERSTQMLQTTPSTEVGRVGIRLGAPGFASALWTLTWGTGVPSARVGFHRRERRDGVRASPTLKYFPDSLLNGLSSFL